MGKLSILNLTPTAHIKGLDAYFKESFKVGSFPYAESKLEIPNKHEYTAIFTNPNMSKLYLGDEFLSEFENLKVVATASTGLTHIDVEYLKAKSIKLISLTTDFDFINRISSTAEHAFALTLEALRNLRDSNTAVMKGVWEYLPFVGRQIDQLTFGVVGFGRLGKFYSKYVSAFGGKVLVYDPYTQVDPKLGYTQVGSLDEIFSKSDVVSIHVHVNSETRGFINAGVLYNAKKTLILVNTSRGEVIKDKDLLDYLNENPQAKYSTDVLTNESDGLISNEIYQRSLFTGQIFITPHLGGMTQEAQEIAFFRTAEKLKLFLSS